MTHPASCGVLIPESGADGVILVQHLGPDGEELRHYLSRSGIFTVPDGVSSLWIELIGGGSKGGADGRYVAEPLSVEPGQSISYHIGSAGERGCNGQETSFGPLRAEGGLALEPALAGAASDLGIEWMQRA